MIVSPPRLVGTAAVAELLSIGQRHLYDLLAKRDPMVTPGYLGQIGRRHVWNLHELISTLFSSEAALEVVVEQLTDRTPSDPLDTVLCTVPGCDEVEEWIGLCPLHLHRLMRSWRHASRSSLVTVQLVAMCQWVVDRNAHLVLPDDFDPWSPVCMTPGCESPTNVPGWHGPLCAHCSAKFWNNAPGRTRPNFWKRPKEAA